MMRYTKEITTLKGIWPNDSGTVREGTRVVQHGSLAEPPPHPGLVHVSRRPYLLQVVVVLRCPRGVVGHPAPRQIVVPRGVVGARRERKSRSPRVARVRDIVPSEILTEWRPRHRGHEKTRGGPRVLEGLGVGSCGGLVRGEMELTEAVVLRSGYVSTWVSQIKGRWSVLPQVRPLSSRLRCLSSSRQHSPAAPRRETATG